jgi:transposase
LKATATPEHIVLFGDSAQVSLLPTVTRCWTKIGQQRVIPTPGVKAPKFWDWGAVDVITGMSVHVCHPRRNNVGLRRLLAAISRAYDLPNHPERHVTLFLDNDRAHSAHAVTHLLDKHDHRIKIEFLPAYSPELNPQEDIWQHLRRRVTHNHFFVELRALRDGVEGFHQELESTPEQVLQLIGRWAKRIDEDGY